MIEPRFERRFIPDSYANRAGKGTHAAVDRLQALARRHRFVLRLDIVKHFASIDHAILRTTLAPMIPEPDVMRLVDRIMASGAGVLDDEHEPVCFEGDDLLSLCRPRGLPIGNLTSQFWSNCYLHPLDQCLTRELGCRTYVRYVDDLAVFSDSKRELWRWKRAIGNRLAGLRLVEHERTAQVAPVSAGIPWLGFVVYPTHRRVKARKVRVATRRLRTLGGLPRRADQLRGAGCVSPGLGQLRAIRGHMGATPPPVCATVVPCTAACAALPGAHARSDQ